MDGIQANRGWYCAEDGSAEQSLHQATGLCDSCRDPELLPRIGDQYQAKIPPLVSKFAYLKFTELPTDSIVLPVTSQSSSVMGMRIPLMWHAEEVENNEHKNPEFSRSLNGMLNENVYVKSEMHQPFEGKGHLVPDSLMYSWREVEDEAFLLGLYTFGKNFVQVKKFIDSKRLEDIQAYYYGKFYRSARYRRWSECRKARGKRCVNGQKIFAGWRQRELLSRLLLHVSEESKTILLEVAKIFEEGKMRLEEFVFTLKAIVGLNVLVEAVGISKGKRDLTDIGMESSKSNQAAPNRPEVSNGKTYSSLTPSEIVNILTGGYRLSKTRSDDIFWDAVWPCLLSRGWHSEQPRDYLVTANRHSLVFLIPGIKKFSRRKLVKGNHYFDSVADVLNKVASDPALLGNDTGAIMGHEKDEESNWINETSPMKGDVTDQQRHSTLKIQCPVPGTDSMRFTVIDTSLANGVSHKVRELRSLPVEIKNISASQRNSEESDEASVEETSDDSDRDGSFPSEIIGIGFSRPTKNNLGEGISCGSENLEDNASKCCSMTNTPSFPRVHGKVLKDQKIDDSLYQQPRKTVKGQAIPEVKPGSRKFIAPHELRLQSLNSCGRLVSSCGTKDGLVSPSISQEKPLEQKPQPPMSCGGLVPSCGTKDASVSPSLSRVKAPLGQPCPSIISGGRSLPHGGTKDASISPISSQEKVGGSLNKPEFGTDPPINDDEHDEKLSSCSSLFQVSLDDSSKQPLVSNIPATERPCEKPKFRPLFDLNTIPTPEDAEVETSIMENERPHHERMQAEDCSSRSASITVCNIPSEQSPNMNSRRHSTRNGPPTAKALEAFAAGLYSTKHKRKSKDDFPPLENLITKSSRHPQSDGRIHESFNSGIMNFKQYERGDDIP